MYLKNLTFLKRGNTHESSYNSILKIGWFSSYVSTVVPRKRGTFSPNTLELKLSGCTSLYLPEGADEITGEVVIDKLLSSKLPLSRPHHTWW